jgi:hypothetical protein
MVRANMALWAALGPLVAAEAGGSSGDAAKTPHILFVVAGANFPRGLTLRALRAGVQHRLCLSVCLSVYLSVCRQTDSHVGLFLLLFLLLPLPLLFLFLSLVSLSLALALPLTRASPRAVRIDDFGFNDIALRDGETTNEGVPLTPTLNKLAEEGILLDNYYVQPSCSPSRACFMR